MRFHNRLASAFALCLSLSACATDIETWSTRLTTAPEREFADHFLRLATAGHIDSMMSVLAPELQTADVRIEIANGAEAIRRYPPDSLVLIGVNVHSEGAARIVNLSWEYQSGSKWLALNVAARHEEGVRSQVSGFNVVPLEGSLRAVNAFTLRGKSVTHFAFVLLALGAAVFSLVTATRIAFAREMPRRWRWVALSLVGVTKISINWTSGAVAFHMLSVTLLSAGTVQAAAAAPMFLYFSFPIGTIVALQHYRSARVPQRSNP